MKRADVILSLLLLVASAAGFLLSADNHTTAHSITVSKAGHPIFSAAINTLPRQSAIRVDDGEIILLRDGNTIRVIESPCPDKLCVHHQPISKDGESIICLPEQIVITVSGGVKEQSYDAILR